MGIGLISTNPDLVAVREAKPTAGMMSHKRETRAMFGQVCVYYCKKQIPLLRSWIVKQIGLFRHPRLSPPLTIEGRQGREPFAGFMRPS